MDKFLIKKAKVAEQRPPTQSVESDGSESDTAGEKKDPKRKFRKEWLTQFNWLKEQNGSAYCTACEKSMVNHVAKLKRHTEQSSHVQNVIKKKGQVKLDSFLKEQNDTLEKQIRNAEFSLVMFIIAHNLPFILMDYLPNLLAVCCPDSKIAQSLRCGRTKSTQLAEILGNEAMKRIVSDLRTCKFSLIVDETTDVSTTKCLVLVVSNGLTLEELI
ncbi:uncharacterized protein LOC101887966 [Musca domestica]|uniref:Uncharacterized protein LOC101887966 n=1 Tax=Musca domestica TaxID=7370 RepID=A0ABM3VHK9_MUSDO|nr:uncharacterized protein LOC101887966 [Musca domestica]